MSDRQPDSITLADVQEARQRLSGIVARTPLIRLDGGGSAELYLKLENLPPIRSFKVRGAGNAIAMLDADSLQAGVYTASAGNMAQGLAWNARRLGVRCTAVVPAGAPHSVLVPFGGGGMSCGIAAAIKSIRPEVRVFGCEVETAAPLAAALAAGGPVQCPRTATFVDGIGGPTVLPEMWPPVSRLLAGSLVVSLAEVAAAIRHLVQHAAIVAEGAAGAAVAAALKGLAGPGRHVAIVSGGNIDPEVLGAILAGQVP